MQSHRLKYINISKSLLSRITLIISAFLLTGCDFNGTGAKEGPTSKDDPCKSLLSNKFVPSNFEQINKIAISMPDTISGDSQIFVMNIDGSGLQQLTCSEKNEASNPPH